MQSPTTHFFCKRSHIPWNPSTLCCRSSGEHSDQRNCDGDECIVVKSSSVDRPCMRQKLLPVLVSAIVLQGKKLFASHTHVLPFARGPQSSQWQSSHIKRTPQIEIESARYVPPFHSSHLPFVFGMLQTRGRNCVAWFSIHDLLDSDVAATIVDEPVLHLLAQMVEYHFCYQSTYTTLKCTISVYSPPEHLGRFVHGVRSAIHSWTSLICVCWTHSCMPCPSAPCLPRATAGWVSHFVATAPTHVAPLARRLGSHFAQQFALALAMQWSAVCQGARLWRVDPSQYNSGSSNNFASLTSVIVGLRAAPN